jgi:hypothetical protein
MRLTLAGSPLSMPCWALAEAAAPRQPLRLLSRRRLQFSKNSAPNAERQRLSLKPAALEGAGLEVSAVSR